MAAKDLFRPSPIPFSSVQGSKGILDDYAVRKNVATKEGTIEKVPTADNDIVNKAYVTSALGALAQNITYLGSCGGFNVMSSTATDCGLPFTVPAGTCEVNDVLMFIVQCYGTTPISSSPQITPSGGSPIKLTNFLQTGAEGMYVAFARTKVIDQSGDTSYGNIFGHCVRATTASGSESTVSTGAIDWMTGAMDIVLRMITSGATSGGGYMSCWHIKGGTGVDPSTIMVDYVG